MWGKLELKAGALRIWPLDYKKYAPQASSASPRSSYSGVRRPLDLPHTTSSKPGRTAIECDNKLGSGSSYARSGCNPITHYITKTQDKQTGGNWQLVTGWRVAASEAPSIQALKPKNKNQGGDQGRRYRPVRVAFRLRTVRVHWHRHRAGGFCGPAALLRRCGWLRTPRCRSQRQRAR